jgi:hypothetical protein
MGLNKQIRFSLLVAVAITGLLVACNGRLEKPPLEVLQRESLLGAGKIIQIKSTSSEELTEIEITIKTANREVRHTEMRLAGFQTVEIGWKKLDGWQIPNDARIEVRAAGYMLPVRATLRSGADGSDESG